MKTHPELGLDPRRNGAELAVLGGVEVVYDHDKKERLLIPRVAIEIG
jgi:hypothetical protein